MYLNKLKFSLGIKIVLELRENKAKNIETLEKGVKYGQS